MKTRGWKETAFCALLCILVSFHSLLFPSILFVRFPPLALHLSLSVPPYAPLCALQRFFVPPCCAAQTLPPLCCSHSTSPVLLTLHPPVLMKLSPPCAAQTLPPPIFRLYFSKLARSQCLWDPWRPSCPCCKCRASSTTTTSKLH